ICYQWFSFPWIESANHWILGLCLGAWNFNIFGAIILGDSQLAYSFSKAVALNLRLFAFICG
ncbi:MAG: hypothetical protein C3F06_01820, partial [Candidatus Methanoperedenaceae archaeon]